MSLRTPRRRISPRARRRYRAIRNFFRRTLSSLTSLSGNKLNSSTTDNIGNLNRATMGHQLHAAPPVYCGLASVGDVYRRQAENFTPRDQNCMTSPKHRHRRFSDQGFIPNDSDTKVLYKTNDNLSRNSHDCGLRFYDDHSDRKPRSLDKINYAPSSSHDVPIQKPKRNKQNPYEKYNGFGSRVRKRGNDTIMENSVSGLGSCESLSTAIPTFRDPVPQNVTRHSRQQGYARGVQPEVLRTKRRREKPKRHKSRSPHASNERRRKKKNEQPNDDQQFIADIIKRQYKPVSFFGRRASDISQISTPVCRDEKYSPREMVIPESELSLLSRGPAVDCRRTYAAELRDMRSLCDTRYNSAPWPPRLRRRRAENYNDSKLYDVVPVKEKTSPKSRRKFVEDHFIMNEVPPSPRTHRPRLNLETQNYKVYEDYEQYEPEPQRKRSPNRRTAYEHIPTYEYNESIEETPRNMQSPKYAINRDKSNRLYDDIGTMMSSQHCFTSQNNTTSNTLDNSKTQDNDESVVEDKTDKALSEIKNILQNFLQDLKKDSSTSQCGHVSGSDKNSGKNLDGTLRGSDNETSNATKNTLGSSFNCGFGQPSIPSVAPQFVPGFTNPCCYPQVIPMYGAHGLPYLVASPSCVCANVPCHQNHAPQQATDTRDAPCRTCSKVNCTEAEPAKSNCETDLLIREIYNYVARNPGMRKESMSPRDQPARAPRRTPSLAKSQHTLHDAAVGTPPLRCYSKSCEAIVSRQQFDPYYATYPSYSDSLLEERISRETVPDYLIPRETNEYNLRNKTIPVNIPTQSPQHPPESKFASALRLLRKNSKKNRKENIHEVCHSERSIEVDVIPKAHNFNQEFATYSMYGQEYEHPPPLRHDPRYTPSYEYDYSPYRPHMADYPRAVSDRYTPYHHYDCGSPEDTGSMCEDPYEHCSHANQPTGPLCLKEVEVRSIGIQSEKKTSFKMFSQKKEKGEVPETKKDRPLVGILRDDRRTDTKLQKPEKPRKLFNLKSQATPSKSEPMASFTERIQKDITKNDKTMTNEMLRKLFYKRNPFSPQNRFVRTIMEKDTTVFKWRPRLFI